MFFLDGARVLGRGFHLSVRRIFASGSRLGLEAWLTQAPEIRGGLGRANDL